MGAEREHLETRSQKDRLPTQGFGLGFVGLGLVGFIGFYRVL